MSDIPPFLKRQAAWQKRRATLSWPAKIRIAAAIRDAVVELQRQRTSAIKKPRRPSGPPAADAGPRLGPA